MLRWRNWDLKYVGVEDRAFKLCPVVKVKVARSGVVLGHKNDIFDGK